MIDRELEDRSKRHTRIRKMLGMKKVTVWVPDEKSRKTIIALAASMRKENEKANEAN